MIKNERQYKITKHQASKFLATLATLSDERKLDMESLLLKAQADAIRSQLNDLTLQIEEYERLQQHRPKVIEAESLEDIPRALVQARIAKRLSQKDLAERLGMKEQQVQRYEATDYASASLTRIIEVANALSLKIRKIVQLPDKKLTFSHLFSRLKELGFSRDFVMSRLIPPEIMDLISEDKFEDREDFLVLRSADSIGRVYGWTPSALLGAEALALNGAGVGARFKMPRKRKPRYADAYIVYAHYLAMLVLERTKSIGQARNHVFDAKKVRENVLSRYGSINYSNLLAYVWDLGIPVLPLNDSGSFHGACWRVQGRNMIVLKQQSQFMARWAFDLLHELCHAGEELGSSDYNAIDTDEYSDSSAEKSASLFAGDVLLEGRAEELAEACVREANGKVNLLKRAAVTVAKKERIELDYLANYLAYRLSLQQINWWGTANNLQQMIGNPWAIARDRLLQGIDLTGLDDSDQRLLQLALAERGE